APNMLNFAQAISRRLGNQPDIQQPTSDTAIILVDDDQVQDHTDLQHDHQGQDHTDLQHDRPDSQETVPVDSSSDTLENSSLATMGNEVGVDNSDIITEQTVQSGIGDNVAEQPTNHHRDRSQPPVIDLTLGDDTRANDTDIKSEQTVKTEATVVFTDSQSVKHRHSSQPPFIDLTGVTDNVSLKREAATFDITISINEPGRKVIKLEGVDRSEAISILDSIDISRV
ncbi:hypothetical protein Plec18170_002928, partial [Paecilomyces lecythidis]